MSLWMRSLADCFVEYWNYLDRPETFIRFASPYVEVPALTSRLVLETLMMRLGACWLFFDSGLPKIW